MAIASYRYQGREYVGVVDGDHYVPLAGVRRIDADTGIDAIDNAVLDHAGRLPAHEAELLPLSWAPLKVFCVGLNYKAHIQETGRELPEFPVLFTKFASTLLAADRPIVVPPESSQVDYEGELAVIIGRSGRRIPRSEAMAYVLGFTVANDVTMRDYQYKTHQWLQGKAWDSSTPLGPHLVRPGEFDLSAAGIRTIVDGLTVQESDLSYLIFDVPALISTISEFTTLNPGDVILTGTPGGVGYRRDPQLFLRHGMSVTVEIGGVGRIDSVIVSESLP
jgi:acylpyruvate hydrolase